MMRNTIKCEKGKSGASATNTRISGYVLAAACVGAALLFRMAMDPIWKDRLPFAAFFFSVLIVAQFSSPGPAIFAMVAGFLAGDWFFTGPRHSLFVHDTLNQVNALCYFLLCLGVLIFSLRMRRALERERAARLELDELAAKLRQEVAERKQAQQTLLETQELTLRQERLAAVGQLAAGLAHEFNNILTVIQGHAYFLLDKPNMDKDALKSVSYITYGVDRTAALVKQMLAFSRKQVMRQRVVHLQETMSGIEEMLRSLVGERITLSTDIAAGLPPIMADPEMLQQIMANLAVNARDVLSKDGRLTIGAAEVEFGQKDLAAKPDRRPGRFVRLSVADTGPGIEPSAMNHLFEPFFTTKEPGKGNGLGLATVYGMVKQNAGWIEVDSAVGAGATFNIFFPAADGAENSPGLEPRPHEYRAAHT